MFIDDKMIHYAKKSSSPLSRAIILVDDRKIRLEYFAAIEKIEKKLTALQNKAEAFQNEDQKLYENWFDLTFRNLRYQVEQKLKEYNDLCHFHNWIIAESRMKKISMDEAAYRLRREAENFKNADELTKEKIRQIRQARDEFIQNEQKVDELDDEFSEDSEDSNDEELKEKIEQFQGLSDEDIHHIYESEFDGVEFLVEFFEVTMETKDPSYFLRAWDLSPKSLQNLFKRYSKEMGVKDFEHLLKFMRANLKENGTTSEEKKDGDDQTFVFSPEKQEKKEEQTETLKLIYRQLVRRLHPDLWQHQGLKEEQRKTQILFQSLWGRVQKAYQSNNFMEMKKLKILVALKQKDLNTLSIDEIKSGVHIFKEELMTLEEQVRFFKKHPWWNFSKKRETKSLEKKIAKEFQNQLVDLETQIYDLHVTHNIMEMMYNENHEGTPGRKKRTQSRKRKKTKIF